MRLVAKDSSNVVAKASSNRSPLVFFGLTPLLDCHVCALSLLARAFAASASSFPFNAFSRPSPSNPVQRYPPEERSATPSGAEPHKQAQQDADSDSNSNSNSHSNSNTATEPSTPVTPGSFAIPPPTVVPRERVSANFRYNFSDETTKFYCEVWYADEFRQLRRLLIDGNEAGKADGDADGDKTEEAFVRSLSR